MRPLTYKSVLENTITLCIHMHKHTKINWHLNILGPNSQTSHYCPALSLMLIIPAYHPRLFSLSSDVSADNLISPQIQGQCSKALPQSMSVECSNSSFSSLLKASRFTPGFPFLSHNFHLW